MDIHNQQCPVVLMQAEDRLHWANHTPTHQTTTPNNIIHVAVSSTGCRGSGEGERCPHRFLRASTAKGKAGGASSLPRRTSCDGGSSTSPALPNKAPPPKRFLEELFAESEQHREREGREWMRTQSRTPFATHTRDHGQHLWPKRKRNWPLGSAGAPAVSGFLFFLRNVHGGTGP